MKQITTIFLVMIISTSLSFAYDFSYIINNPSAATADDYIVSTSNAVIKSETDAIYWKQDIGAETMDGAEPGTIIYHFNFDKPVSEAKLFIRTSTFHWDYSQGHSYIYASTDGSNWIKLVEALPPEFAGANTQSYNDFLPASFSGSKDIWLKVELNSYGSNAANGSVWTNTAQHSRYSASIDNKTFQLDVDYLLTAEVQSTTGTSFSITPIDADTLTTSGTIPDVGALLTLENSSTTIQRDDGSILEVKQKAVVSLNPESINILRGEVTVAVSCNYEVQTPLANITSCPAIQRGAESAKFTTSYSQNGLNGSLKVTVISGTVDIIDRNGATFTIAAGNNKTIQSIVPRTSWVLPIDNDKLYGGYDNLFIWTEYPDADSYLLEFNFPEPVFFEENPGSAEFQQQTAVLTSDFYIEYDGLLIFILPLPKGFDGIVLEVRLFALDKQGNIIADSVASDRSTITVKD
ncbi:MAG: FecR family protein [gamma proteobacterium symbiont of Taylorina sp.]|nr:FecR family protein [gamma proteobacterium symbiont of Taylorina sp.]